MNKEALKVIFNWVFSIIFILLVTFTLTIFAAFTELKNQNDILKKENTTLVEKLNNFMYEGMTLEPCVNCGEQVRLTQIGDSYKIACDRFDDGKGCGLETGYYESKAKLIDDWNSMHR